MHAESEATHSLLRSSSAARILFGNMDKPRARHAVSEAYEVNLHLPKLFGPRTLHIGSTGSCTLVGTPLGKRRLALRFAWRVVRGPTAGRKNVATPLSTVTPVGATSLLKF